MIQDISPRKFSNAFMPRPPKDGDYVIFYGSEKVLLTADEYIYAGECGGNGGGGDTKASTANAGADEKKALYIPRYGQLGAIAPGLRGDAVFLFTIDDTAFYLIKSEKLNDEENSRLAEMPSGSFRTYGSKWLAFAGITACQLAAWYERHTLCGKCGEKTRQSDKERMLECPACGSMYYPRISPAVIVGVTDGQRLLLTRYANRPGVNYALIAGFCEIGESVEDTVRREVMEETGIRVKNVRFYKSQPWGFSSSLLMGFYCDLDGDDTITLDGNELGFAGWFKRDEIAVTDTSISLTSEMIENFRSGHSK